MATALQVVGHKKSGKTLVVTALLTLIGPTTVIKHTHEPVDLGDIDSARFFGRGAEVTLLSPTQAISYQQPQADLAQQVATIVKHATTDLVLIEGGKALPYPKLVLLRPGESEADFANLTGPLTFARLEEDLATPEQRSRFLRAWLAKWQ